MIAWGWNGRPESMSGSIQAGNREWTIDFICFLCVAISDGPEGRNPLFFTISVKNHT
jgi:hypothetical protein